MWVLLLAFSLAAGQPPCFGSVGQSRRGIDVGFRASSGPFSGQHFSRWNYSVPAMRYDVFEHNLQTNVFTESNNLFRFAASEMTLYVWDDKQNCTQCPLTKVTYECIPSNYRQKDLIYVLGQKCIVWADDLDNTRNVQVASMGNIGPTPWLLNIIAYDSHLNVAEAVQIQNFRQGVVEDPTALDVPSFCVNAPRCKSAFELMESSPLPLYLKRQHGWVKE